MKIKQPTILVLVILFSMFSCLLLADEPYYGTPPIGWYWNNEPHQLKTQKKNELPKTSTASLEIIKKALDEAKARAVLYPTPENVYTYLVFQHWVQEQSVSFTKTAQDVVAVHPELNYEINHPALSSVHQVQEDTEYKDKVDYVKNLAQHSGLFYFYRGKNKMDAFQANTLASFAKSYGFKIIGIPMDGYGLDEFDNRPDSGQSRALGVTALPALFLVEPVLKKATLITYGYVSTDELLTLIDKRTQQGIDHEK